MDTCDPSLFMSTMMGQLPGPGGNHQKESMYNRRTLSELSSFIPSECSHLVIEKTNSSAADDFKSMYDQSDEKIIKQREDRMGYQTRSMSGSPLGLLSKEITPFEWQILEQAIKVFLYYKKPIQLPRLAKIMFENAPQRDFDFQIQYGNLYSFVQRHSRVFLIHECPTSTNMTLLIGLKIGFVRKLLLSHRSRGLSFLGGVGFDGSDVFNNHRSTSNVQCGLKKRRRSRSLKPQLVKSNMFITEDMEKEIITLAIKVLFTYQRDNYTIGKLGQILHRRMENPMLPRMFKSTYGGLKKFFEHQSTIFAIKKDHLFNPVITLQPSFLVLLKSLVDKNRENVMRLSPLSRSPEDKVSRPSSPVAGASLRKDPKDHIELAISQIRKSLLYPQ